MLLYEIDADKVLWREIEGVVTLLMLETGRFFELNKTGGSIWKLIAERTPHEQIVSSLCEEHDLSIQQAEQDLQMFLKRIKPLALKESSV